MSSNKNNFVKNKVELHPSGIPQNIVEKVMKRRGRLHAFEQLIPSRTALVVVDMDTRTLEAPDNGRIRALAKKINKIADALRLKGGTVAWVTTPIRKASANFIAIYGEDFAKMNEETSVINGAATTVWKGLNTCLLYTSPSPRDQRGSRMPSSA